jgi:hypothetical protein
MPEFRLKSGALQVDLGTAHHRLEELSMDESLWAHTVLRSGDAPAGARRDLVRYLTVWGRRNATASVLGLALPLVQAAASAGEQVHLRFCNLDSGVRVEVGATTAGTSWHEAAEHLESKQQAEGEESTPPRRGISRHGTVEFVWFEVDASSWARHARPENARPEKAGPHGGLARA